MKKAVLILVSLINCLAGSELLAETPEIGAAKPFVCQEQPTVRANEIYLSQLGSEIDELAIRVKKIINKREAIQNVQDVVMGTLLLKKVLCFHQIEGGLVIFEAIDPLEGTPLLKQSRMRLSLDDQARLSEALTDLARAEDP